MQQTKQFREKKDELGHYIGGRVTEIMDSFCVKVNTLAKIIEPYCDGTSVTYLNHLISVF